MNVVLLLHTSDCAVGPRKRRCKMLTIDLNRLLDSSLCGDPSPSLENPESEDLRSPVQRTSFHMTSWISPHWLYVLATQVPLPSPETMPSSPPSMDSSKIDAMFENFEYKLEEQGAKIAALANDSAALQNDNVDLQDDNEGLRSRIRKVEAESKASIHDSQKWNNELELDSKRRLGATHHPYNYSL